MTVWACVCLQCCVIRGFLEDKTVVAIAGGSAVIESRASDAGGNDSDGNSSGSQPNVAGKAWFSFKRFFTS